MIGPILVLIESEEGEKEMTSCHEAHGRDTPFSLLF